MKSTRCIKTNKDHYILIINDVSVGVLERSELRNLIKIIDNEI